MPWLRLLALFATLTLLGVGTAGAAAPVDPLYVPAMVVSEANFRGDPSTSKPPLDTFQAGKQVLITGVTQDDRGRDWFQVKLYEDGTDGYIYGTLLRPIPDFPNPPGGLGVTTVKDAAEGARLVGRHGLTLQWIGVDPQGEIVAFEDLGLLYMIGWQDGMGAAAGDTLDIKGWVTEVGTNSFRLKGSIVYRVASLTSGKECKREGDFVFSRTSGKNYWRLEPIAKPCGDWDQYIDIYLRKE